MTNSIEFSQSIFVPDSITHESKLDKVLKEQRALDVQELINLCNRDTLTSRNII